MLNYNRALSDEKSYQDLQIREVQPTIKLIIRGKKREFFSAVGKSLNMLLPTKPNSSSQGEDLTALWLSPDEWMVYSNKAVRNDTNEYEIEKLLRKGPSLTNAKNLGRARRMEDAIGRYIELIKLILRKDENLLGMKIVLDCANGAGYKVGTEALFELGCEVVSIHKDPDGTNINENCGAMFPNEMALKTKVGKCFFL